MTFGTVEQAIADIRAGKFVVVADDEDRENEGDLVCAAEAITPEMVNFMIRKAGGLICLALTPITPVGLPEAWPVLLDEGVVTAGEVVIGSGVRGSKLLVDARELAALPSAEVLALALS